MSPQTITMIEMALKSDNTLTPDDRAYLINICKGKDLIGTKAIEQYYTASEFAKRLSVRRETVSRWIKSGVITSIKINGTRRIPASAIEHYNIYGRKCTPDIPPIQIKESG